MLVFLCLRKGMQVQFTYTEVKTEQNIFLNGFFASHDNKSCVLFMPGLAGNFLESKFARVLADDCLKNGMDFLFAHNQGSFQIMDFPYLKEDGKLSNIRKGAAYEHFEDCVYDFDAWLKFVSNYESVYLVVHSLGCNKVVYYLQERQPSNLKKLVLLAPQDSVNFPKLSMHKGMLEEAQENIANNQADKLLTKKLLGGCLISSQTYYDFITNKKINNIPYKTPGGDMSGLQKITCPVLAIIGSKEDENAQEYMQKVANSVSCGRAVVIPDANHVFKNQEKVLSDKIIDFLKN